MIDWYMLLAPLVALPIVLLFAFVGAPCVATEPAEGPGTAVSVLTCHIERTDPLIKEIHCTFSVVPGGTTTPDPIALLTWADNQKEQPAITLQQKFEYWGDPVDCTCHVDLFRVDNTTVSPEPATAKKQSVYFINFRLNVASSGSMSLFHETS